MIYLHIIAAIQTCFLPGFLLLYILHRDWLRMETVFTFSFGLSLLLNYILVFFLVNMGLYLQGVILSVFVLEVLTISILAWHRRSTQAVPVIRTIPSFCEILRAYMTDRAGYVAKTSFGIFFAAIFCMLWILVIAADNIGHIFQTWDAVVSWNRWATVFAMNSMPTDTMHYPQLLPANWSLTYVITGTNLQFLPRAMMPAFLCCMVFSQILIGLRQRSHVGWLVTAVMLVVTLKNFEWTDGMTDIPVAFFAWASVLCILLAEQAESSKEARGLIFIGGLFAITAAVTKQAGLYILILYPLVLCIVDRQQKLFTKKRTLFLSYIAGAILVAGSFYIFAEYNIAHGRNSSEVIGVTSDPILHNNQSYFERILPSLPFYAQLFGGWLGFSVFFALAVIASRKLLPRLIFLAVCLPYVLLWSMFFSYDMRNAALSVPVFCMVAGIGGGDLLKTILIRLPKWSVTPRFKFGMVLAALVLTLAGVAIVNNRVDFAKLTAEQQKRELKLGDAQLNKLLFDYNESQGFSGMVLTDYQYFGFLPKLRLYYTLMFMTDPNGIAKLNDPRFSYILVTPYYKGSQERQKLIQFVDHQVASGLYTEIFSYGNNAYRLIKLR